MFDFESRYDDNIFLEKVGTGDFVTLATPELWWRGESPATRFEVGARRRFYSDTGPQSLRTQTDAGTIGFDHSLSEQSRLRLDYDTQRSRDPLAFDASTAILNGEGRTRRQTALARYDAPRGLVHFDFGTWAYEDSGLTDARAHQALARFYLTRTGVDSWFADYRREDYEHEDQPTLTSNAGTFGLKRLISEYVSAEVEGGVVQRDLGNGEGANNDPSAAFELVASTASPAAPITLTARGARQITDTWGVEVARGGFGINWSVGWERTIDAEGGIYQDPVIAERWNGAVRDTLPGGSMLSLKGSYSRSHPTGDGGPRRRLYRATAAYHIPLSSWLTAKTEYEFTQQGESGSPEPFEFRRGRYKVSLQAALPY